MDSNLDVERYEIPKFGEKSESQWLDASYNNLKDYVAIHHAVEKEGSSITDDEICLFNRIQPSSPQLFKIVQRVIDIPQPGIAVEERGVIRLMVLNMDLPSWYFPIPRNEQDKFKIQEIPNGKWITKIHNSYWIIDPEKYPIKEVP